MPGGKGSWRRYNKNVAKKMNKTHVSVVKKDIREALAGNFGTMPSYALYDKWESLHRRLIPRAKMVDRVLRKKGMLLRVPQKNAQQRNVLQNKTQPKK